MKKKLFEYGIDFLYLVGGLIISAFGIYIARYGVGMDTDGDALIEKILLSTALFVSAFLYFRYALHFNYPNNYVRTSLLFMLISIFPYSKFHAIPFNGDIEEYMLAIASIFGLFMFLFGTSLVLLFIGYMKGRTNLENVDIQPKIN